MGLILFFGFAGLVAAVIIIAGKGKKQKRIEEFQDLMLKTMQSAVPMAGDIDVVMAQGCKDTLSQLKDSGKDLLAKASVKLVGAALGENLTLRTAYTAPPSFIIGYNSDEMYAVCVGCHPTSSKLEPDMDFILHFTPNNIEKIKFGIGGKITIDIKDSNSSFIVTVTDFAVSMMSQPDNNKKFSTFIKEFAAKYDLV